MRHLPSFMLITPSLSLTKDLSGTNFIRLEPGLKAGKGWGQAVTPFAVGALWGGVSVTSSAFRQLMMTTQRTTKNVTCIKSQHNGTTFFQTILKLIIRQNFFENNAEPFCFISIKNNGFNHKTNKPNKLRDKSHENFSRPFCNLAKNSTSTEK